MEKTSDEEREEREVEGDEPAPAGTELEQLARERDEYLESWRRARADYQNLRRRQQAEVDAAVAKARAGLLSELLLVLDFLDMALSSECRTDEGRALKQGVELTRGQLAQILEQQGVRAIAEGGRFDPALHQAVDTVPTEEREPGEVVETVRRGYRLGEHVLRHAHVRVSTRPEGAAKEGN